MAGLDFWHGIGLVHDDISPQNIILDDGRRAVIIVTPVYLWDKNHAAELPGGRRSQQ